MFVYMQVESWDGLYPLSKISRLKPGTRGKRRSWFGAASEEFPVYREWPAMKERKCLEKRERVLKCFINSDPMSLLGLENTEKLQHFPFEGSLCAHQHEVRLHL